MRQRILLVDDEPTLVTVLSKRLEAAGFDVLVAKDGEDAVAVAFAEHPDAIVLDLVLPKRTGFEACKILRKDERFRNTPIVFYTGKVRDLDEDLLGEWGADAFLTKAEDSTVLISKIKALLAKREK